MIKYETYTKQTKRTQRKQTKHNNQSSRSTFSIIRTQIYGKPIHIHHDSQAKNTGSQQSDHKTKKRNHKMNPKSSLLQTL